MDARTEERIDRLIMESKCRRAIDAIAQMLDSSEGEYASTQLLDVAIARLQEVRAAAIHLPRGHRTRREQALRCRI